MLADDQTTEALRRIVTTDLLDSRPAKTPDYQREVAALSHLAEVFATAPDDLGTALVQVAMSLTGAQAAGISLEDTEAAPQVFRWIATAGTYERYLHGTMPRDFSPCGEVLGRNHALLMRDAVQLYGYMDKLHIPAHEVLLVPFHHQGKPIGTVWVVSHDDTLAFDKEDLRIVQTLTRFAAAAVHTVGLVRKLSEAQARQQEMDTSKDRFMAVLAHEMRGPLSAITVGAQAIKLAGDDPTRRNAMAGIMERQAQQLSSLVNDLTDVAAIGAGKLSLRLQKLAVSEIFARTLEVCAPQLHTKHQLLDVQLVNERLTVTGDLTRLTQVMVNLLTNAIKYTPDGGHIILWAEARGGAVELGLTDRGRGLAAEEIPQVFDMFMQVEQEHRSVGDGLGIGLALVKQLVELHQGSVSLTSPGRGQGTTVTVRLPVA